MTRLRSILISALLVISSGAALQVEAPEYVAEGEPFLVTISGDGDGEGLLVRWLDREIAPKVEAGAKGFRASALLGVGMREKLEADSYTLEVEVGPELLRKLIVREAKAYPEQHLSVDNKYNELDQETLDRHGREKAATRKALNTISQNRRWALPLTRPVPGDKTSDFGLRRFFNEVPKNPHSGVDLRAARGDSVLACAAGLVLLAGDHYFAGNSVYVDHGEGVVSMYFHLDEISVEEGEELSCGQLLGRAGSTGRVTGPHLHWGLSLQGQLVDPMLLVD